MKGNEMDKKLLAAELAKNGIVVSGGKIKKSDVAAAKVVAAKVAQSARPKRHKKWRECLKMALIGDEPRELGSAFLSNREMWGFLNSLIQLGAAKVSAKEIEQLKSEWKSEESGGVWEVFEEALDSITEEQAEKLCKRKGFDLAELEEEFGDIV